MAFCNNGKKKIRVKSYFFMKKKNVDDPLKFFVLVLFTLRTNKFRTKDGDVLKCICNWKDQTLSTFCRKFKETWHHDISIVRNPTTKYRRCIVMSCELIKKSLVFVYPFTINKGENRSFKSLRASIMYIKVKPIKYGFFIIRTQIFK